MLYISTSHLQADQYHSQWSGCACCWSYSELHLYTSGASSTHRQFLGSDFVSVSLYWRACEAIVSMKCGGGVFVLPSGGLARVKLQGGCTLSALSGIYLLGSRQAPMPINKDDAGKVRLGGPDEHASEHGNAPRYLFWLTEIWKFWICFQKLIDVDVR